ncbi:TPA: DUF3578 domain-containing protein [Enterobacter hormaechei]|nr:DUF3578 domain-containing protein [Enterobacter hormaechei]
MQSVQTWLEKFVEQADQKISQSTKDYPETLHGLKVKVSFGFGNYSSVPWIAFLAEGQEVSHGIYPVILYYKDYDELILAYGISDTKIPLHQWHFNSDIPVTIREYLHTNLGIYPKKYGQSYYAFSQKVSNGIDYAKFDEEIEQTINVYKKLFSSSETFPHPDPHSKTTVKKPYDINDALNDLFIPQSTIETIIKRLVVKKNVILQGPPGVGKTFVARRLAYLLMEERDSHRVGMVQFHPSYSYEDFVQGYRPNGDGFQRKDGIFYSFCQQALKEPDKKHVFIIDEINRANLSKVFGEVMMLIEHDKRNANWAVPLTYSVNYSDRFYIPANVYIIGLMNTADRSLAVVDYALRRRFSFIDIEPGFGTEQFRSFLLDNKAKPGFVESSCFKMMQLNNEISNDSEILGKGYRIGHSYFCNGLDDGNQPDVEWFRTIVFSDIAPLLEEYWFDNPGKRQNWLDLLLEDI